MASHPTLQVCTPCGLDQVVELAMGVGSTAFSPLRPDAPEWAHHVVHVMPNWSQLDSGIHDRILMFASQS
ncbi:MULTISPECIES: hypothetical protein [unclassified Burkholderia]|uniref:hypothetical protein n=1 Tax=unclassified Burkholderia TaxID=2613784 RepID=UPI000F5A00CA|nr:MULTISPECIES: hypothetical protein [unclassified Burkholderia]